MAATSGKSLEWSFGTEKYFVYFKEFWKYSLRSLFPQQLFE